jgi:hypothetical protein
VTAIAYVLANWQALCRYPEGGELGIDNNLSERSLRAQAVVRKTGFLSAGTMAAA